MKLMKLMMVTMCLIFSSFGFADDGAGDQGGRQVNKAADMYEKSVTDYNDSQTNEANRVAEYCPSCNASAATQKDAINKQITERGDAAPSRGNNAQSF
jgi:hypothetical protein